MECKELIHPFQNDPGVSQRQRVMDDLLSGSEKIDGRTLADLLDYFVQLSRHINYYDASLRVTDWQPFFRESLPFTITAILKYDKNKAEDKLAFYNTLFDKRPGKASLQLLFRYIYHAVIKPVNAWSLKLKNSGLPVELLLDKLIKDKLADPLKLFIIHLNAAVKWYDIKPISFKELMDNEAWNLEVTDIYANFDSNSFKAKGTSKRKRLIVLRNEMVQVLASFLDAIQMIEGTADLSMEQSIFPLKEELKEKHTPHLALLFSFLKLFQHLQGDLNTFTKKHLDFFYKEVLCLKAREASPDQAHIVFEIQNQLNKHLLEKGLLVKDGKDINKAEVLFSLDDEIVVNKAQVADKRTLFINNQIHGQYAYAEGVYMAPDAAKADGIDKEFKDDVPASWPTLGAQYSKYTDPENKFVKPYPNARLGFILASPVLLLNEGDREVTITLSCMLNDDYCGSTIADDSNRTDPCCEGNNNQLSGLKGAKNNRPDFFKARDLYGKVQTVLGQTFYVINRDLIAAALKKGISKSLKESLNDILIKRPVEGKERLCYCPVKEQLFEKTITEAEFNLLAAIPEEKKVLLEIFKPRKALNVLFSGEKEWISPAEVPGITLSSLTSGGAFKIFITAKLQPEQKAVTFYNAEALKEDFNTTMPVVKIELDDKIKLNQDVTASSREECCERKSKEGTQEVSLYHFFRNATISADKLTKIDVKVCGLKNFIVQNDESLQNVNGPVYPFGTRPSIIDFDVVNPSKPPLAKPNLVGPNFYIGSKEVFCKKWNEVNVNLNWKDKPFSFNEYYKGYALRKNYHDCISPANNKEIYGLNDCDFEINLALLERGSWTKEKLNPPHTNTAKNTITLDNNRRLFFSNPKSSFCVSKEAFDQTIKIIHNEVVPGNGPQFNLSQQFNVSKEPLENYRSDSREGFLRINLQGQDFLHKDYSYVLARQMMAFGRYPDLIDGAVYVQGGVPMVFDISIFFGNIGPKIIEVASNVLNSAITGILTELINILKAKIAASANPVLLNAIIGRCKTLLNDIVAIAGTNITTLFGGAFDVNTLSAANLNQVNTKVKDFVGDLFALLNTNLSGIENDLALVIRNKFDAILNTINTGGFFTNLFGEKKVVIPNEPWTPIIKSISIDYTATAGINDIDLIHLYPYQNTFKSEELELQPALFPTFCDEGSLYIGLKDLQPGSNLNMLFQLAEATADSESQRVDVQWYYLENNLWKLLRKGFEVLDDDTDGLTTSGIIKFALPANMTNENTILPKGLHWVKVAIPYNSKSVSETIGVFTQAIRATFTNEAVNDKLRLVQPLPAGSVAKLNEADSAIKKVSQPFDSFAGRMPEGEGHFYVRVSELLRHKGRAIQKFDYERLALEAFPQLFKVKCINHSFALDAHQYTNDMPMAPGYVLLAVIPDLNQLKAAQQFEPRVPVSILEDVQEYLKERTSPFVRLRVMNPRYEKVNFCLKVKLYQGKDESFYKEKLKQDLKEFLAPWAIGQYDKLTFGQCIYQSDMIGFLETRDYLDYIIELKMQHEEENADIRSSDHKRICPVSPRSVLIGGDIDVCIQQQDCERWGNEKEYPPCTNKAIPIENYCTD